MGLLKITLRVLKSFMNMFMSVAQVGFKKVKRPRFCPESEPIIGQIFEQ